MSGFSSRSEDVMERGVNITVPAISCSEDEFIDRYDLHCCAEWVNDNHLEKVCLQFPDSLLCDSVKISLWLERQLGKKVYILGDTSYGSCCVDEVAAEHIKADGVIHFGHACLSPTTRLPVLYVFPKYTMNVTDCISVLRDHLKCNNSGTLLILDVGFSHYSRTVQDELSSCDIVCAEPIVSEKHNKFCSQKCLLRNGNSQHSVYKLGRGYCLNDAELSNIVFIGQKESRLLYNYRISFEGTIYCYNGNGTLEIVSIGKSLLRRFYLIERLKDANTVGIIVGTLGVKGYLDAIKRISSLVRRKGKKCYVISIGKPNPAKLANFPEIEVYIMISCPEAVLENEKDFYQPILSVMEAETALNEGRAWCGLSSGDFRDLLPGGKYFVEVPKTVTETEPDVSLVSNKIRYDNSDIEERKAITGRMDSDAVQLRADMTVDNMSSNLSNRSWRGLDPMLAQVAVAKAVPGRSGIPQSYSEENHCDET